MNLRALFQRRSPRALPQPEVLSALPYQAAHDLACGRDPEQERVRRLSEKARLPVRHRPYDPAAGAAYDATRRPAPARAVQTAPPVFCLEFGAAPDEARMAAGAAAPELTLMVYDDERIPDHVLEEEAGRPAVDTEMLEAPATADGEEALMAILSAELRGAVGRAATRARSTPLHGAA
ncbi:hypothetical protein [Deinococcus multiflagellatus]|uniref:Uncharacterized protein n=1 Tax=Deinococcus multiflagellatus TaxID=1656887 RepID=A0ABW1ZPM4_9DEIO|nr:hypothetical protein [Deinococcus multiflagellatus]MBZ9715770.1 hypothetical protein [Deinococcus multiflagellatus]